MNTITTPEVVVLGVHLLATAAMTGLIWFVQIVHYPLFDQVGHDGFVRYEQRHRSATSLVVGPFMAVEGALAIWLLADPPGELDRTLPLLGCLALAVVHASTVAIQVPAHTRLSSAYDATAHRRLVRTNWIRTIGWSTRAVIAVVMLVAV